jgi:hypothetical protein
MATDAQDRPRRVDLIVIAVQDQRSAHRTFKTLGRVGLGEDLDAEIVRRHSMR